MRTTKPNYDIRYWHPRYYRRRHYVIHAIANALCISYSAARQLIDNEIDAREHKKQPIDRERYLFRRGII